MRMIRQSNLFFMGLALMLMHSALVAAPAVTSGKGFVLERVAEGFSVPWGMAFVSEKEMLITEKAGRIYLLNVDSGEQRLVKSVAQVSARGQGGLMDVAISTTFDHDSRVYFTYSRVLDGEAATTLAQAKYSNGALSDWRDLLVTQSWDRGGRHFGSRIAVLDDVIFMTVGDRGHRPNGQDLKTHAGSILRLKLDGTPAENNPFSAQTDALPEIWSYGHRNPQGVALSADGRQLWAIEHGPRGGDELNLIKRGENYGWAKLSHGKEYWGPVSVGEAKEKPGFATAKKIYTPSIAPSSLLYYTGAAFPQWQGSLFSGALKIMHLNRLDINEEGRVIREERLLEDAKLRIRSLAQGPEGFIYLSTDSGDILRLRPN